MSLKPLPSKASNRLGLLLLLFFVGILLTGCAAPKPPAIFYPPEPDLPRLQFLKSLRGAADLQSSALKKIMAEDSFMFKKAYGLAFHKYKLFVVDSRLGGYAAIDFINEKIDFISNDPKQRDSSFQQPFNIAIATDGTKYISDIGQKRILAYSADDHYLRSYRFDSESAPLGVATVNDKLYVTDMKKRNLTSIDITGGETLMRIGNENKINWPVSLAIGPDRSIYVADMGRFKVVKFSPEGQFLREYGKAGDTTGSFSRPKGIAISRDGLMYVIDAAFENVQIFTDKGRLLMFLGQGGGRPEDLALPAGIAISYELAPLFQKYAAEGFKLEYIVAVASQSGPSKINIYGYGKMEGADYSQYEKKK